MLNKTKYITRTAILLTLSAFMSCAEMEDPQTGAVGYLAAPSLDVDVTVQDISLTKAAPDLNTVDMPSSDAVKADVKYVVKKKGSEDDLLNGQPWTDALTLPAGETYVVEAFYGDDEFDGPCLYGSREITIAALETAQPDLNVKVSNSLLCVSTDPLDGHFTMTELVMKSGDRTCMLTKSENAQVEDTWIWIPADRKLELEIKGTNSIGNEVSFTHAFTPSAGYAYNLISGKPEDNWPKITMNDIDASDVWATRAYVTNGAILSNMSSESQNAVVYEAIPSSSSDWSAPVIAENDNGVSVFKGLTAGVTYQARARVGNIVSDNVVEFTPAVDGLSVSAAHTYSGNELDGTDVQTAFAKSDLVKNAVSSWTVNICKSDGTVLRSETALGTSDGSALTGTTDWPYLPVGNNEKYIVRASATIDGQRFDFADIVLAVPSTPDISLTLGAYTSYDKYAATNGITKDIDSDTGANRCDPSTLYNAGGKWGISVNIMSNENYTKKIVINFDGDDSRTYLVTSFGANEFYENISGCSWDSHQLSVSLTFDNKTVTKTQTHHITGLPHRSSPPVSTATDSVNGWTTGKGNVHNWNSGYLQLGVSGGQAEHTVYKEFHIPTDINVSLSAKIAAHNAPVNTECSILLGSSSVMSVNSDGSVFNYKTTEEEGTVQTSMNASSEIVTLKNSYSITSSWGRIYYVNILYR